MPAHSKYIMLKFYSYGSGDFGSSKAFTRSTQINSITLHFVFFTGLVLLSAVMLRYSWQRTSGRRRISFIMIMTVIYFVALFYYTFLSRMDIPGAVRIGMGSVHTVEQTHKGFVFIIRNVFNYFFRMQVYDIRTAMGFNILLFIPFGYIIPIWISWMNIRNNRMCVSVINKVMITGVFGMATSAVIELLQGITGLGMTDMCDWICNTAGVMIGIIVFVRYIANTDKIF